MISKDEEIELYKQSIQEADEIIAELKYNSKLLRQARRNEQDKRRKFENILEKIKKYCEEQNLKVDYTACEVLSIIEGDVK